MEAINKKKYANIVTDEISSRKNRQEYECVYEYITKKIK